MGVEPEKLKPSRSKPMRVANVLVLRNAPLFMYVFAHGEQFGILPFRSTARSIALLLGIV
jgi:hypothetical protein